MQAFQTLAVEFLQHIHPLNGYLNYQLLTKNSELEVRMSEHEPKRVLL